MTVFDVLGQYIFVHTKFPVFSQAKIHFQRTRQSVPVIRQCWSVHLRHDMIPANKCIGILQTAYGTL